MKQDNIIRLIVIEESANEAEVILNSLRKARYPIRPRHVEDDEDLQDALTEQEWDLIIAVPQVGDFTVGQVCEMVNSAKQDIPVIVLVSKLEGKIMAELLKAGGKVVIPSGNDACLQMVVGRELENLTLRRQHKHLEQLYKESQKQNKMLLETSKDAIAYVHDGMHTYANPSYLKMFDYSSVEDLEGLPIMDLLAKEDRNKFKDFMRDFMTDQKDEESQIELEGLKSNNKRFGLAMEIGHAIYEGERCLQVIMRDRTQSQDLELKLKELSRRDQLTGLFNRQYFMELLEKALAKAMETHTRSVLLYITLDNFDSIKQRVGLGDIDPVIQNISKVLKGICEGGILARLGEDVFSFLLNDKDKEYANELAEKICKTIESTVTEVGQSVMTTCSIGIEIVFASTITSQEILSDALAACKIVMDRGGNGFEVYKAVMKSDEVGKLKPSDLTRMVETAIEENRLSLRFQPIISLRGDTQEIYEVFLRMVDAVGNQVPTGEVFETAEKANLSVKLDKWVMKESIKILVEQHKKGHKTHFFIKLSDQAIKDADVLLSLKKLLKATQLPGERVIIELSESTAITQIKMAQAFIKQLQASECKSALEHFGTGLNYATTLKHLPVDYVKIDSSFSKGLSANPENQQAVQNIVKTARELGKLTIAESVEDANSLAILWTSEVDFAQGHYFQEPLDAPEYDFSEE